MFFVVERKTRKKSQIKVIFRTRKKIKSIDHLLKTEEGQLDEMKNERDTITVRNELRKNKYFIDTTEFSVRSVSNDFSFSFLSH